MSTFKELQNALLRTFLGFVVLLTLMKISLKKLNGFDVLAVVVLASASVKSLINETGYILEIVVLGIVMATVTFNAGANRRGTLFVSGILVLSDAMVQYEDIVGELDDLDKCMPVKTGAAVQSLLLGIILYGTLGEDSPSNSDQTEIEMKRWILTLVSVSVIRSLAVVQQCSTALDTPNLVESFSTLRVICLATVCIANGEDETEASDD
ncbi:MAG: hypothetical protein QMC37_05385 [Flavobacteriales bacterium]